MEKGQETWQSFLNFLFGNKVTLNLYHWLYMYIKFNLIISGTLFHIPVILSVH